MPSDGLFRSRGGRRGCRALKSRPSPDRKAERPAAHLARFSGIAQIDGYPDFDRLSDAGRIQLAGCWPHARRKFYEVQQATGSPVYATLGNPLLGTMLPQHVRTILIAGYHLDWCVEQTARTARDIGYNPIVIGDATAAGREADEFPTL